MTAAEITDWLTTPTKEVDTVAVQALAAAYPYFLPARYMQAAAQQDTAARSRMLGTMRLYTGNWLLFHQLMQQAALPKEEPPVAAPPTVEQTIPPVTEMPATHKHLEELPLIQPVYTEDYFRHEGIVVDDHLPEELDKAQQPQEDEDPKSLMVVMSFSEWLMHFKSKSQKEKEEEEDRKAVKTMWQKEKLAAALEEENDEIPENVFEMAVNSIAVEEGLASEALAEILTRQGKTEKAIEMYKKLSLRNPQKSAYFAQQIAQLQKNSDL